MSILSRFRKSSEVVEQPIPETNHIGLEALADQIPVPYVAEGKLEKYLKETYPYVGEGGYTDDERLEMQDFLNGHHCKQIKSFFEKVEACLPQLKNLERTSSGGIKPSAAFVELDEKTSVAVAGVLEGFFGQEGWDNQKEITHYWNKAVPVALKKVKFSGEDYDGKSPATLYRDARHSLPSFSFERDIEGEDNPNVLPFAKLEAVAA